MSVEQPQKVLGMPVSYHNLIYDGPSDPLDLDMPRLQKYRLESITRYQTPPW
jgi:hypothetical protein